MTAHRLMTAALVGVVAALVVGGVEAKAAFDAVQREGFSATVAGLKTHIVPPSGGGKTVELGPQASSILDTTPMMAVGAGVVVAVVAFVLTRP